MAIFVKGGEVGMIDRQKVLDGLKACADRTGALCRLCPYDYRKESCISDMAEDALELLKEQPEQKHGHWISFGCGFYRCSVCDDRKNMNFVPDYCSTCGAKMDEEVKQE